MLSDLESSAGEGASNVFTVGDFVEALFLVFFFFDVLDFFFALKLFAHDFYLF